MGEAKVSNIPGCDSNFKERRLYYKVRQLFLLKSELSVLIKCDSYCKGDDYCDRKLNR